MIKAIFFDIDGTLLSSKTHSLLPGTLEAFDLLHKKGIRTFISSGRPMTLIPTLPVHFDGFITVNGGYCLADGKVIHRNPISADDTAKWLDYVKQTGIVTMCFTADNMYINRISDATLKLRDQLGFTMPPVSPLENMSTAEVYQFIAMQPKEDDTKALECLSNCRMPRWHPVFTDVIPADSSKAVGISNIIAHYGIDIEETMAFGDGANDIEMLQYVKIGVAMGNASDEVKRKSDYVTLDSDSEGILSALEKLKIIK